MRRAIEDLEILQIGVCELHTYTQRVGEWPYGSTAQPTYCWHQSIPNWRLFKYRAGRKWLNAIFWTLNVEVSNKVKHQTKNTEEETHAYAQGFRVSTRNGEL